MAKIAFLFPGQGAQVIGMGKEVAARVPAAADLFRRANDVLGYDLLERCLYGPEAVLNSTVVSQPALFVAGLAAVELLRQTDPVAVETCQGSAGLSLGEYTALVFAGAMSFEDGLKVVKARGAAMQEAADAQPGGMVSVLGLDEAQVQSFCDQAEAVGQIRIANYLCPGNLVVSGDMAACDRVERLANEAGAMKTIRLAVAGAFHSPAMRPAATRLAEALAACEISAPRIPVYSNVDAAPHDAATAIREILVRQVLESVRWEASMRRLLDDGYDRFFELGPGRVLAGLMKRIHRKAEVINVTV